MINSVIRPEKAPTETREESTWLGLFFSIVMLLAIGDWLMLITNSGLDFQIANLLNGTSTNVSVPSFLNPTFANVAGDFALIVLAVLLGTASMRQRMQIKQRRYLNKIQAQQSVGIATHLQEPSALQTPIPTFGTFLKRNTLISCFLVPLTGLMIFVASTALNFLFDKATSTSPVIVYLVLLVIGFGALYTVAFTWRAVARLVDRHLQPKPTNYFAAEPILPVQTNTALAAASPLAQSTSVAETDAQWRSESNTPEAVATCNWVILFVGMMVAGLILGLVAAVVARQLPGVSSNTIQLAFAIPSLLGVLFPFIAGQWLIRLFPKPQWQHIIEQWTPLLQRGKYDVVLAQADRLVQESPNWAIRANAAAVYAEAGQFEKAEQLLHVVLRDLVEKIAAENERSDLYNNTIRTVRVGLINVLVMAGKLDEAEAEFKKLPVLKPVDTTLERALAKLYLYRGQVDRALLHLNAAEQRDHQKRERTTSYTTALSAWGAAAQGDAVRASGLIEKAFKLVAPENVANLAEVYLYQGHVARVECKSMAACDAFQKAIGLNPDGMYGLIAQRELDRDNP